MIEFDYPCDSPNICPEYGAYLHKELLKDENKIVLTCQVGCCSYEKTERYSHLSFTFVYRDEFITKVKAKNLEEAIEKIETANWQRTVYSLWNEYLDFDYEPVLE